MHTQPFGVTISDPTVRARGDLDMAVTEELLETIRALAQATAHHAIVLDLAELTFMDSTGINLLIQSHQELERMGKELVIQSIPDRIQRTLDIAGVVDYLNVRSALV